MPRLLGKNGKSKIAGQQKPAVSEIRPGVTDKNAVSWQTLTSNQPYQNGREGVAIGGVASSNNASKLGRDFLSFSRSEAPSSLSFVLLGCAPGPLHRDQSAISENAGSVTGSVDANTTHIVIVPQFRNRYSK